MSAGEDPAFEADAPFSFSIREPWKNSEAHDDWCEQSYDMVGKLYPNPGPFVRTPEHEFICDLENHYGCWGSKDDLAFTELLNSMPAGFWANPINWRDSIIELVHAGKGPQISELYVEASSTASSEQIMHGFGIAVFVLESKLVHTETGPITRRETARLNALRIARRIYTNCME